MLAKEERHLHYIELSNSMMNVLICKRLESARSVELPTRK